MITTSRAFALIIGALAVLSVASWAVAQSDDGGTGDLSQQVVYETQLDGHQTDIPDDKVEGADIVDLASEDAAPARRSVRFQGVLTNDGRPVTGTERVYYVIFDSQFLCDEAPIAPGDGIARTQSIEVDNGLLNMELQEVRPTGGIFDGRQVFLKLGVVGYGIMADCEEILPAPLAISLVPGATIRNATGTAVRFISRGNAIEVLEAMTGSALKAEVSTTYPVFHAENTRERLSAWFETGDYVSTVIRNNSPAAAGGYSALEVQNGGVLGNLIVAFSNSNLVFRVHGNGNVTADGTFVGGGADYADLLPVSGNRSRYSPGDVLIIASDGSMMKAAEPNSPKVAGVFSTQPAVLGDPRGAREDDAQNDGLIPVALTGVVATKVTDENGAITPGDLLTTSGTVGHAMKALPVTVSGVDIYPTGTILGKALEPHASGEGVIDVLLMSR